MLSSAEIGTMVTELLANDFKKICGSGYFKNLGSLLNGRNGHFVSMPSEKWNDGSYHDITYFKGKKAQDYLKEQIENAYEKIKGSASNDESNPFE